LLAGWLKNAKEGMTSVHSVYPRWQFGAPNVLCREVWKSVRRDGDEDCGAADAVVLGRTSKIGEGVNQSIFTDSLLSVVQ
jgi:hypothetical protein